MTGGLDRHRCTEGETGLRGRMKAACMVHVCVTDRQRGCGGAVLTPHLLFGLCLLWQKLRVCSSGRNSDETRLLSAFSSGGDSCTCF